jgi:NADH-quinone oxidoreductase subunit B
MEGLQLLQHVVGTERRPLSWVVGSQEVRRPEPLSMRDLKRERRVLMTEVESPDGV